MARLLFVSNTARGIYIHRGSLMRFLKREGHDIIVATSPDKSAESLEREFQFVPIKRLARRGTNVWQDLLLALELYRLYKAFSPDLIVQYTVKPHIYGSIAAGMLGARAISVITGLGYTFVNTGLLTLLVKYMYKLGLSLNQNVIFVNRDDHADLLNEGILCEEKTLVLPGEGVDTEAFSPDLVASPSDKRGFSFLFVGRLLSHKGIDEYVKAAGIVKEKYPETDFLVLGPIDRGNPAGISEAAVRDWERQGNIRYLGITDKVKAHLQACDVVVLPSYYREGMPRALLEAMAMAKPVITTDNTGCRETVEDGRNGFMVPIKDVTALASAMERMLLMDDHERRSMGQYSRVKVLRDFDERDIFRTFNDAICNAIKSRQSRDEAL